MSPPLTPTSGASPTRKPEVPEAQPRVARGEASGTSGLITPPLRWNAKRKAEVALRLLRGESLDKISRETAVPIPRLEEWLKHAMLGLESGLQTRETSDPAQQKLDEANRRIGELSMENELLRARCEKNGPFVTGRSRP
jgi:transposase